MTMPNEPVSEQLQQLQDRIRERIEFHAKRYREQLVARLAASGDPDWIMSVLNQPNHGTTEAHPTHRP